MFFRLNIFLENLFDWITDNLLFRNNDEEKKPILGKLKNTYFSVSYGWGNSIEIVDEYESGEIKAIYGYKPKINWPIDGNILRSHEPLDGKIKLWEIFDVESCDSPANMFTGRIKFLGYSKNGYTLADY